MALRNLRRHGEELGAVAIATAPAFLALNNPPEVIGSPVTPRGC